MNALAVATEVSAETIDSYLFSAGQKLNDQQKTLFLEIAKSCNLNPFKREIYAIPYEKNVKDDRGFWTKKQDMTVVTGYQVYLERATSTGLLDGWNVKIDGYAVVNIGGVEYNIPESATITIHRKDFKFPFEFTVDYDEFAKKDKAGAPMSMWKDKPIFMLKKVAMGIGFRLAFPNELGGLPYLREEMDAESNTQESAKFTVAPTPMLEPKVEILSGDIKITAEDKPKRAVKKKESAPEIKTVDDALKSIADKVATPIEETLNVVVQQVIEEAVDTEEWLEPTTEEPIPIEKARNLWLKCKAKGITVENWNEYLKELGRSTAKELTPKDVLMISSKFNLGDVKAESL